MALAKVHLYNIISKRLPQLLTGTGLKSAVQQGRQLGDSTHKGEASSLKGNHQNGGFRRDEECLSSGFRNLSLTPAELNQSLQYELPTTTINTSVRKGYIFERTFLSVLDCPAIGELSPLNSPGSKAWISEPDGRVEISDPRSVVKKEAKNVLKIRRRKMNRHHLKKLRKKMKFVYRRKFLRKMKRKEAKLQEEFRAIMKRSEDFDPEHFIQENLRQARLGGFRVNIFASGENK